uniref:DNA topoisomerase I DNA binding eukaryotic-type domain-containing protein n=1 Tax=Meloidogyne incognita TaxID=6306 RepID=A0A914KLU7_MELIC
MPMDLSPSAEEVATFYAKMLDHDYTSKPIFNQNFFKDWRKTMTSAERSTITDLKKCDFRYKIFFINMYWEQVRVDPAVKHIRSCCQA